jgi:primosomal protein N' (replication factor Y)
VIIVTVVFPIPIRQYFKYFLPDSMKPIIGSRVIVPFKNKNRIAVIISFFQTLNSHQLNLKFVKCVVDTESLYTDITIDLLIWIVKNYHCPIGCIFFLALPKSLYDNYVIKKTCILRQYLADKNKEVNSSNFKNTKLQLHTLIYFRKQRILTSNFKKQNLSNSMFRELKIKNLYTIDIFHKLSNIYNHVFKSKKKFF